MRSSTARPRKSGQVSILSKNDPHGGLLYFFLINGADNTVHPNFFWKTIDDTTSGFPDFSYNDGRKNRVHVF
jgi:hypothetical protein